MTSNTFFLKTHLGQNQRQSIKCQGVKAENSEDRRGLETEAAKSLEPNSVTDKSRGTLFGPLHVFIFFYFVRFCFVFLLFK